MKRNVILVIMGIMALVLSAGNTFAAPASCADMEIIGTGTTPYTPSGIFVKVKPSVTNDCGTAGTPIQYFLDVTNTDATYATILTAFSLTKKVFMQVADPAQNSLVLVLSIKQ